MHASSSTSTAPVSKAAGLCNPGRVTLHFRLAPVQRRLVILAARNPFKEAQQDVLPGGVPNTPVRRISYEIAHALTPRELMRLMQAQRHTAAQGIWRSKHEAAVLQRVASLIYYKALTGEKDSELVSSVEALLKQSAEVMAVSSEATRQMEGSKMRQLLASCARLGATVPRNLSDAMLTELLRDSGKKLPKANASHMAELVWALAMLRAGFRPKDQAAGKDKTFGKGKTLGKQAAHQTGRQAASAAPTRTSSPAPASAFRPDEGLDSSPPSFEDEAVLSTSPRGSSASLTQGTAPVAATQTQVLGRLAAGTGLAALAPDQRQLGDQGSGPGPGAPAWEASGQGSPLVWPELQRCVLLSLQQQLQQQQQRQQQRRQRQQGPAQGSGQGSNAVPVGAPVDEGATGALVMLMPSSSAVARSAASAEPSGTRQPSPRGSGHVGPEGLSQIAWAFAVAGCHDPQLFQTIEEVAVSLPGGLAGAQPRAVANLVYAFAKAGQPCPRLLPQLCSAFTARLVRLTAACEASPRIPARLSLPGLSDSSAAAVPRALTNGTGAGAAGGSTSVFAAPAMVGVPALPQAVQQPLPGSATGVATAVAGGLPTGRARSAAVSGLPEAPHIAKVMWATAVLRHKDAALLDAVAAALPVANLRFTADELAHVAWSLAQHHHHAPAAFEHLAKQFVLQRMYGISDTQLAMLASAFASADPDNEPLFRTVARLTAGRLDSIPSKDLVAITCALAIVGQHSDLLIDAATGAAMRDPAALGSSALAELLATLSATRQLKLRAALMTRMVEGKQPATVLTSRRRKTEHRDHKGGSFKAQEGSSKRDTEPTTGRLKARGNRNAKVAMPVSA